MKSKKVYIGIAAVTISLIIVIASIFYIKASNKDVEVSEFEKNVTNENTKEAMKETNEVVNTEDTNEESKVEESEQQTNQEEQKIEASEEEPEVEVKKEEPKVEVKKEEPKVETKKETPKVEVKKEEPKKEIQVTPITKTMFVNATSLNVRSGPDTSYTRIGSLAYAQQVNITGTSSDWYRISYGDKTGFVRGDYLSDSKPEPKIEPQVQEQTQTQPQSQAASVSSGNTVAHLIIINSRNNTLRYYTSGSLVKSYSCATGTSGTPTPQGKFSVNEKIVNRPYYKLNIPGGAPNNPLGPRWLQFKSGGYAIHGTNVDSSIGTNASHGCVRMHNSEVIELYSMVPMGATVIVKNTSQSDKEIAAGYGIHID